MKTLVYGINNWDEFLERRREALGESYFRRLAIETVPSEPIYTGYKEME